MCTFSCYGCARFVCVTLLNCTPLFHIIIDLFSLLVLVLFGRLSIWSFEHFLSIQHLVEAKETQSLPTSLLEALSRIAFAVMRK